MVRETTIAKLISVFMPELAGEFSIRELAKRAGISYDAAYRHTGFLTEKGVLKEKTIGKATACSLNLNSIITRKYLENISVSKTQEFLEKDAVFGKMLGELVENLRKSASDELLCTVLFGSYARGEQKESSDIDILIIASTFEVRERLERECGGIEYRHGVDIAPLITTASEFKKMLKSKQRMVAHEVQLDGMVLYGFEKYYQLLSEGIGND